MKTLKHLLIYVFVFITFGYSPAFAETGNELVVDDAGVFGSRLSEVEEAARRLAATGADVRVRTVRTLGGAPTLDHLVRQYQDRYPSWQSPNGNRKSNLVVVMIAMKERQLGISNGGAYDSSIAKHASRIRAEVIGPRLKGGDFAGAFVAGLNELTTVVQVQANPNGGQTTVINSGPPPDLSGLWTFLKIIAFIAGGVVVFIFVGNVFAGRARRRAAQQKAKLAKQGASNRIVEMQSALEMPNIRVNALMGKISEPEREALGSRLSEADRIIGIATGSYNDVDHSAGNPDRDGLSEEEYEAMCAPYERITNDLRRAEGLINEVVRDVDLWEKKIQEIPQQLNQARSVVASAIERVQSVKEMGFFVNESETAIEQMQVSLEQAATDLVNQRFDTALKNVDEALSGVKTIVAFVDALPSRKTKVVQEINALEERVNNIKEKTLAAHELLKQLGQEYVEGSLKSVNGNDVEAKKRQEGALRACERAKEFANMDTQKWGEAENLLSEANRWLDEAESFVRSIEALAKNLEEAKENAPAELRSIRADIQKANEYIARYDDDIRDSLWDDLRSAQRMADDIAVSLGQRRPDYIAILGAIKVAHAKVDTILNSARNEHEQAERLRARLTSEIRDAKSAISRAEEYIADHRSDVGRTAKNRIQEAKTAFQSIDAISTIEGKISVLEDVKEKADAAYKKAKSDFSDAEDERERERVQRNSYSGYGGGYSSPSYNSGNTNVFAPISVSSSPSYGSSNNDSWGSWGSGSDNSPSSGSDNSGSWDFSSSGSDSSNSWSDSSSGSDSSGGW